MDNSTEATNDVAARRLAAILLAGGSMHFLAPGWFDKIIPRWLPGNARTYTSLFGAAALATGAGLTIPRTRRLAAGLAATFFVSVMPAKIKLTADWLGSDDLTRPAKLIAVVQLFWQIPLITEAIKVIRTAPK